MPPAPRDVAATATSRAARPPPHLCRLALGPGPAPPPRFGTPVESLAELVHRECGFLRIRGHGLRAETSTKAKKRGIAATICFYVRGLPWVKRTKWLMPLFWSVAPVLQRCGCTTMVQGGELYVSPGSGAMVRIDFAAARK